ncbi:hypothetical protein [Vibrio vulnificus]|uniref:hypothetical protein n=1 Tax=Vibrio vulnificus TaxID=672 RepID=UPI001EE9F8C4|nr:hypothetical protein [Vibrio vulnificus]MCG6288872.1 hypothetical protein [Vibrio vulnificus]
MRERKPDADGTTETVLTPLPFVIERRDLCFLRWFDSAEITRGDLTMVAMATKTSLKVPAVRISR